MAPIKRVRPANLDDDVSETCLSEGTNAQRKRARTSYERSSDDDLEDVSDDRETEDEQATQYMTQQRRKTQTGNAPADNEVSLGPLINFIIGHNGSGKSAILTAITICLGGKATATNRGQSLKSFIKEGTESSILGVKIKNKGDSSYQSELYGDSIIVERHFSRSGNSNFKLKSSTGKLISTRKADLEEICDYFALQIDNPMNVLTQDMARQFLSNSTPQEKYKFFMKGTQLEHLDGDYLQIEQSIDKIDQDLAKSLGDVGRFEEEARKAKGLLDIVEKQDSLRRKIDNYRHQMAWAQVEEEEANVVLCDQKLVDAIDIISNAERKEKEFTEAYESAKKAEAEVMQSLQELKDSLEPHQERKTQVKQEHDKIKAEKQNLETQRRQIKQYMKLTDERIEKTEADIQQEYRRLAEVDGGNHAQRLAQIEEKRGELAVARTHLEDFENKISIVKDEKKLAAKQLEQSQLPIAAKRREMQDCETRLNSLMRDKGRKEGAYRPTMSRLLYSINEDAGFRQKPVGPIGHHIRLLRPTWSSILEKSFGGVLDTFIVTSKSDQARLSELMAHVQCQCPIMIGNSSPLNTADHEPDKSFETSLRTLEIDNELVRKQLIINQAIEQTILIENRTDAVSVMSETRIPNVKQCFTHNVKPGTGLRISYGWGGHLSSTYVAPFTGLPRMKTDIEFQVSSCRDELQHHRLELNDLERNVRECQANIKARNQAIVRLEEERHDLRIKFQKIEDDVEGLQDALESDAIEEGRLEALKDGLAEAKDELSAHQGSFGDAVVAIDRVNDSLKGLKDRMAAIDIEVVEVDAKIRKIQEKVRRASDRCEAASQEMNKAVSQAREAVKTKMKVEKEHEDHKETVALWTEEANKIHPRVAVDRGETSTSLDKKLGKLSADLQRWDSRLGRSRQEIASEAERTILAFQQAKSQVEGVEKLAQLLKSTLINRKERWQFFQKAITARARVQFMWMLSERSFRGRLLANHKEKKLDLIVEPDETRAGKGRETKTLSGGEKSFSTICLLLSLWDAMGAPVRCLDEFDVFMDSVNREVSMRKMIEAARCSVGKQFILITPQSMGNVSHGQDVKIIKMRDPERGQTTISFEN